MYKRQGLCGGLFAVFLILVPPMPGWYTWVVPFITVFFIDFGLERYKNLLLYVVSVSYTHLDVYKRQYMFIPTWKGKNN